MKLFLLRHGESTNNLRKIVSHSRNRWPLTERGREQILQVSQTLVDVNFDAVLISPILRTRRTAKILAENCPNFAKTSSRIVENLTEIQMGMWNNRSRRLDEELFTERDAARREAAFSRKEILRGGESFSGLAARMCKFLLSDLANFRETDTLLIISHADPILSLQKVIREISDEQFVAKYPDNAEIIELNFSRTDHLTKLKNLARQLNKSSRKSEIRSKMEVNDGR